MSKSKVCWNIPLKMINPSAIRQETFKDIIKLSNKKEIDKILWDEENSSSNTN